MTYPHTIEINEVPVPPKTIQVVISTDFGTHITKQEFYAEPQEFLDFWKPLVKYYEGLNHDKTNIDC